MLGSTGHPVLGEVTSVAGAGYSAAVQNVTVPAGSSTVNYKDGVLQSQPKYLTIVFNGVSFSGGQFYLLLSKDGFASASAGDIAYSPTFQVSDLTASGLTTVSSSLGNFYIGSVGGNEMVIGPIALNVSNAYHYVKVYDGSTGAEAASAQQLIITPGILVTPTSGPALTQVKVQGGGFTPGQTVNINYTYPFYAFIGGAMTIMHGVLITGISTGSGWFTSASTPIVDTKQAYNPTTISNKPTTMITLFAVNASHVATALSDNAYFTESNRNFQQVVSLTPDGYIVAYTSGISTFGNDTGATPILTQPVKAYVFGTVTIAGLDFAVSSALTFKIGTTVLTSTVSSTNSTGGFNATVTIPVLPTGTYTLVVLNNGVKYTFNVHVYPTMLVCNKASLPACTSSGTASNPTTTVVIEFYGFPATITEYIYWNMTSISSSTEYNYVNVTTTANGETNTSLPYTFVVPESFGGPHTITAFTVFHGPSFSNSLYNSYYTANGNASAIFTVLPSLVVLPGSFNSTYGGYVTVVGEGLYPSTYYSANIDNQMADFAIVGQNSTTVTNTCSIYHHHIFFYCTETLGTSIAWTEGAVASLGNGVLNLTFIGAGFNPGLHVVSLTSDEETASAGSYGPDIFALFTVTPVGSWDYTMFSSLNTNITNSINALSTTITTAISSAITSINDNTNSQISALSTTITTAISSAITSINDNTNSQISALSTTITTAITTAESAINAHTDSQISALSTTITTAITTAESAINAHTSSVVSGFASSGAATNIQNAVNTEQTYVLVVAVLAAIILVLVLAVLIRKLS